jgi:phage/plasmid-like protein (TIGR03299 family)
MSHEIESMLYRNEAPWHGLGLRVEGALTVANAMRLAGLNWEVGLKPLVTVDGDEVTHRATYRKSDGRILGVVGPAYTPLQNVEAFNFFDPILQAGEAELETAGSLRGGKRIWVLARVNRAPSVIVPQAGDVVEKFVLLSNGHDGTLAVSVGFTPVRVVCANTLAMASESKASRLIRIRHQKNVADTLSAVRDIMNVADAQFEATAEQFRRLAAKPINEKDLRNYVKLVFRPRAQRAVDAIKPAPVVGEGSAVDSILDAQGEGGGIGGLTNEILAETERDVASRSFDNIAPLFEKGRGNDMPGVKGTLWAAYNAVTEFLAHERGKDDETRLDSMWFGGGASINQRALATAVQMTR